MNIRTLVLGALLLAPGTKAIGDGYGEGGGERGRYVCFARDFTTAHSPSDPETEDCIEAYYRGQGICLSHAKKIAQEKCQANSKHKASCRVDAYKDCFERDEE